MTKEYEIIEHTADLKIRAFGITLEELFKNALKGMFASIKPKSLQIEYKNNNNQDNNLIISKYTVEQHITVKSPNREQLLVDFLSECLYLSDVYNQAYFDARFEILNTTELEGYIFGVKIIGFEVVEIKAVTYHDLRLEQIDSQWVATLVFDI